MSENSEILQFEGFENSSAHRVQAGSKRKRKKKKETIKKGKVAERS